MFFVVKKEDLKQIEKTITSVCPVKSSLDMGGTFVLAQEQKLEDHLLVSYLIQYEIKAIFVEPWISERLYSIIVDGDDYNNVVPERGVKNRYFETLVAPTYGIEPHKEDRIFYNFASMLDKNYVVGSAEHLNLKLRMDNLLYSEGETYPTLLDIIVDALKTVLMKDSLFMDEIDEEGFLIPSREKFLTSMQDKNENDFLSVVADFILKASRFYERNEIQDFLENRFLKGDEDVELENISQ